MHWQDAASKSATGWARRRDGLQGRTFYRHLSGDAYYLRPNDGTPHDSRPEDVYGYMDWEPDAAPEPRP